MRLKFDDDGVASKAEVVEEECSGAESRKEYPVGGYQSSSLSKKHNRRRHADDLRIPLMTYKEAKKLMREDKDCGLAEIYDRRHITIGWHQCGHVLDAVKLIFSKSLGRYRHQLKAVPLANGPIEVRHNARVIADQPCMHLDVHVKTIIFRPVVGRSYKCVVTSVGKDFVTAKIFDTITFIASFKNAKKIPEVGDETLIRYQKVNIKESLCQMRGVLAERRTRNNKRKFEEEEEFSSV